MTSRFFRLFATGVLTALLISCTSGKTSSPGNEIRMEKPSYARLFETGHAYGGIIANVYQPFGHPDAVPQVFPIRKRR